MNWDWPENKPETYTPHMIDLQFDLVGTTIPTDNAQMLADALQGLLPWLNENSGTGIQHLKGAETNSGDASLNINRRTKLFVRVPQDAGGRHAETGRAKARSGWSRPAHRQFQDP